MKLGPRMDIAGRFDSVSEKPSTLLWKRLPVFFWRHKFLSIGLLVIAGFSLTPIIIVGRTYFIAHPDASPTSNPGRPILEAQSEGHTCGVHALSTLYRAYGLDPDRERIRWRLGVDTKAVFWAKDTTGATSQ